MTIEAQRLHATEVNQQIDELEQQLPQTQSQAQSGEAIASIVDAVTSRIVPSSLEKAEAITERLGVLNSKVQHAINADPTLKDTIGEEYTDDLDQTAQTGIDTWRLNDTERSDWEKVLTTPRAIKLSPLMHSRMESLSNSDAHETEVAKLLRLKQQGRDRLELDAAIQAKYGKTDQTEVATILPEPVTRRTTVHPKRITDLPPLDMSAFWDTQPKETVAAKPDEAVAATPKHAERPNKIRHLREKVGDLGRRVVAETVTRLSETADHSKDAERSKKGRIIGLAVGALALAGTIVALKNGMVSAPSGRLAEQLPNNLPNMPGKQTAVGELLHASLGGLHPGKLADKAHEVHEIVKLHPGDSIWNESQAHLMAHGNRHPSLGQITEEMHRSMQLNGITEADAKHLPVGHKLKLW